MKVKTINKNTNQQFDCEEVEIDGYKYYLYYNTEPKKIGQYYITKDNRVDIVKTGKELGKPILCSNNPNINIPKVVDEVERLAHNHFAEERFNREQENPNGMKSPQSLIEHYNKTFTPLFRAGYNKSQETHPFSLDDVKEIINLAREQYWDVDNRGFSSNTEGDWSFKYSTEDEIIQKYQETKVLTIFYE